MYSTASEPKGSASTQAPKEGEERVNAQEDGASKEQTTEQTTEQTEQTTEPPPKQPSATSFVITMVGAVITIGGYLVYQFGNDDMPVVGGARKWVLGKLDEFFGFYPEHKLLLPPLLPGSEYNRPYTIVVDIDALVEYTPKPGGFLMSKRAGLDYFLGNLNRLYEVVLYSKEYGGSNQMVIYKLDPTGIIGHHLFKESGLKYNNQYIDDIARLNRDPGRVILIDSTSPTELYDHTNVIFVGKGNPQQPDTILIDLVPLLVGMAKQNLPDIRDKIQEFHTPDVHNKIRAAIGKPVVGPPVSKPDSKGWKESIGSIFGK